MSDRYPGTTNPALERRFKALRSEIQSSVTQIVREAVRTAGRQTIATSEDLAAHIAAANPYPQYATNTGLAAALAALTLLGLSDVDGTGIADGDVLIYDGTMFVPGSAGRPGITYRTIPTGVRVDVAEGEQYLVFQELVIEGEFILDGGELVVL
jgi:hypothetical protein